MIQTKEKEEVCEDCGGTGEVTTMERVYPNEPHMAPIGTGRCHCRFDDDDGEPDDQDEDWWVPAEPEEREIPDVLDF